MRNIPAHNAKIGPCTGKAYVKNTAGAHTKTEKLGSAAGKKLGCNAKLKPL